jgi:DNA replication and repair protein RecF
MRVMHLSLSDYRNYRGAEVEFARGQNLIVGRNGQGKTNLVEAIGYFASLRSHRVSNDAALIRAGGDTAVARMRIAVNDREASLEVELNRGAPNRAQVNRNAVRPRELMRWFSTVLFAPEDLMIVRGEPALRRRFLDDAVIARNPAMAAVLSDYERVVRQRTSLLKSARANKAGSALEATLSVWDEQLVALGSRIMHERRELVAKLSSPLIQSYASLVDQDHAPRLRLVESVHADRDDVSRETPLTETARISASPSAGNDAESPENIVSEDDVSRETIEHDFRDALERVRKQELERAATLIGPHRDDLALELNGLPVKGYASHGESWSFALSLRLALAALLREESPAGDPVIILDDVFAELDTDRRRRLMAAVGDYEQVIVTAAVEEDVPDGSAWRTLRVTAGVVDGDFTDGAVNDTGEE